MRMTMMLSTGFLTECFAGHSCHMLKNHSVCNPAPDDTMSNDRSTFQSGSTASIFFSIIPT